MGLEKFIELYKQQAEAISQRKNQGKSKRHILIKSVRLKEKKSLEFKKEQNNLKDNFSLDIIKPMGYKTILCFFF